MNKINDQKTFNEQLQAVIYDMYSQDKKKADEALNVMLHNYFMADLIQVFKMSQMGNHFWGSMDDVKILETSSDKGGSFCDFVVYDKSGHSVNIEIKSRLLGEDGSLNDVLSSVEEDVFKLTEFGGQRGFVKFDLLSTKPVAGFMQPGISLSGSLIVVIVMDRDYRNSFPFGNNSKLDCILIKTIGNESFIEHQDYAQFKKSIIAKESVNLDAWFNDVLMKMNGTYASRYYRGFSFREAHDTSLITSQQQEIARLKEQLLRQTKELKKLKDRSKKIKINHHYVNKFIKDSIQPMFDIKIFNGVSLERKMLIDYLKKGSSIDGLPKVKDKIVKDLQENKKAMEQMTEAFGHHVLDALDGGLFDNHLCAASLLSFLRDNMLKIGGTDEGITIASQNMLLEMVNDRLIKAYNEGTKKYLKPSDLHIELHMAVSNIDESTTLNYVVWSSQIESFCDLQFQLADAIASKEVH